MAGQAILRGIKDSWSLVEFIRKNGKPKRASNLLNKTTGETFAALMFPTPRDGRDFTMVAFSSNLGELSAAEVAQKYADLQVVELEETGNLYLCTKGSGAWEDIDIPV